MIQISLPCLHLSFHNACPRYLKSRRDLLYSFLYCFRFQRFCFQFRFYYSSYIITYQTGSGQSPPHLRLFLILSWLSTCHLFISRKVELDWIVLLLLLNLGAYREPTYCLPCYYKEKWAPITPLSPLNSEYWPELAERENDITLVFFPGWGRRRRWGRGGETRSVWWRKQLWNIFQYHNSHQSAIYSTSGVGTGHFRRILRVLMCYLELTFLPRYQINRIGINFLYFNHVSLIIGISF